MKKILCFVLSAICLLSFNVAAATTPVIQSTVMVDGINQTITISGKVIADVLPNKIFCIVKDPAVVQITSDNIETAVVHALEIPVSQTTGIFSYTLNMSGVTKTKTYQVDFGSAGLNIAPTERRLEVYLPSVADTQTALSQMNTATELSIGASIAAYVLPANSVLGIYSKELYAQNASVVNKRLIEKRTLLGGAFANVSAFQTAWSEEMTRQQRCIDALNAINGANRETLTGVLTTYNDILSLNLIDYNTYGTIEINKRLVGITYATIDSFISAFYAKVAEVKAEVLAKGTSVVGGGGGSGAFPSSVKVVIPQVTPTQPAIFNDIENYSWAKESVLALSEKGIINGDGNGKFMPEKQVTREEFVKMIMLAFDIPFVESGDSFKDVDQNAWYAKYVVSAKQLGIISGNADGTFGVGNSITREDIAVISVRAAKFMNVAFKQIKNMTFADTAEISNYATDAVDTMSKAGIISGNEDGVFSPRDFATRAQTAKIIYGIINSKQ